MILYFRSTEHLNNVFAIKLSLNRYTSTKLELLEFVVATKTDTFNKRTITDVGKRM